MSAAKVAIRSSVCFVAFLACLLPPDAGAAAPVSGATQVQRAGATWLGGPLPAAPDSVGDGVPLETSFADKDLEKTDWILDRLKQASHDPDHPVVVLYRGASLLCGDSVGCLVRSRKVLLLNTSDVVDAFQTFELPFDTLTGRPEVLMARVIRRDGTTVRVSPADAVVVSSETPAQQVGDHLKLVIPLSKVEVGAVVDLAWQERSRSRLADGYSSRILFRQHSATRGAMVEIRVPKTERLVIHQSEDVPRPVARSNATHLLYRWTLPAGAARAFLDAEGTPYDEFPWLGFSNRVSWEDTYEGLRGRYWTSLQPSDEIRALARRLTRGCATDRARAAALLDYVSTEIDYLAVEVGDGVQVPTPAPEVLRRGYGDCKDKVALLIALLSCVGVDAQPVLVLGHDDGYLVRGLVETGTFTHVIAYLPGMGDGTYCDPTLEPACLGRIPAAYAGTDGLALPANAGARLIPVPEPTAGEHGFTIEYDIRPQSDGTALIEAKGRFRGDLAEGVSWAEMAGDSASMRFVVDRMLGIGIYDGALDDWHLGHEGCEAVMSATYRDTTWTPGVHSRALAIRTEVADPLVDFVRPDSARRWFVIGHPYRDTAIVRLHAGGGWEPEGELAGVTLSGPFYSGEVSAGRSGGGAASPIELVETFENRHWRMSGEEYRAFHRDWLRFLVADCQPLRYHRVFEAPATDTSPEGTADLDAVMPKVQELLGADAGGEGAAGVARRNEARRLLAPSLETSDGGTWPLVVMAMLEVKDGRARAADSLLRRALSIDRTNIMAVALSMATREAVGDREGLRALLRSAARQFPSRQTAMALIACLHRDRLHEEAANEEMRLLAKGTTEDSIAVWVSRYRGGLEGWDLDAARAGLEALRGRVSRRFFANLEASLLIDEGSLEQAADTLEELWTGDPLDPQLSNQVAWVHALLGDDLQFAEELARSGSRWTWGRSSIRNTLGAVLAREGRWEEARGIFEGILDRSDSNEDQVVNAYFVALCDYQTDHRAAAIERWERARELALPGNWRNLLESTLERGRRGQPVADLLFKRQIP